MDCAGTGAAMGRGTQGLLTLGEALFIQLSDCYTAELFCHHSLHCTYILNTLLHGYKVTVFVFFLIPISDADSIEELEEDASASALAWRLPLLSHPGVSHSPAITASHTL